MAKRIIIFGTKGGVGKTLIASNLAVSLGKDYSQRVCLMDLDLHVVGDMARMLNFSPKKSIVELTKYLSKKEFEKIKKEEFLVSGSYGVDFLPGVSRPQQSPHLDASRIKEVIELLDKDYNYIVVDAGKNFNDVMVAALNEANLILLVVTPDILSIYQTKWTLETLQFLHFPLSMIKIVLNRAQSAASISWQELMTCLPVEIIARIPSEGRTVGSALNRGVPVVIDSHRARISVSIKGLADRLMTEQNLFIERTEIDKLRLKETGLEKSGKFWQMEELTEPLEKEKEKAIEEATEKEDDIVLLKRRIHSRLIDEMQLKRLDLKIFRDEKKGKELIKKAEKVITNLLAEEAGSFITSEEVRRKFIKEILDEALGLGPLEDLIADPEITDIMVNNKDEVYIEKHGKIELTNKKFISNSQVKTVIERIIAPIGRHIDESVPMVDARLPDGSRINAIIHPLSLTGPSLTIRKFRKERFTVEELVQLNTLQPTMGDFLKACVLTRKNIIVSGGTGSGKTTVLNVLSQFIPNRERIITIEDAAELKLYQDHWVRLESRPPNIEGKGAITIRDIFRNTLRMRPDRIIIGECRSRETLDMLQAMNTGHDGSMTTLHANSTHDVLVRLDSMILMSGVELPVRSIHEMIASAIDIIVHTARLSDGSRKIVQITELVGMKDELHISLEDIFSFVQYGVDESGKILGGFKATGYTPSFDDDMKRKGIKLPENIFQPP